MDATQVTPGKQRQADKHPRAPAPKISITPDIIAAACVRNSSKCMVSDQIHESIPGACYISTDLQTIRWTDKKKGLRYVYLTPRNVQIAIVDFDKGIKPAPFSFRLRGGAVHLSQTDQRHRPHRIRDRVSKTKAKIVKRGHRGTVPDIVGGRTPPIASAHMRTFGLRNLGR
jgi:hypothetical protein